MNLRIFHVISAISIGAMLAISVYGWTQLPPDAQVPVHWNTAGEIDGYASKAVALWLLPAMAIGLVALLSFIPRLDPRRTNLYGSSMAYQAICSALVIFLAVLHGVMVAIALGATINMTVVIGVGIGALFVVIGSVLGRTRSNWFMGVRTPWTLESEASWQKTHTLAGRLFIDVGVASALASFLLPPEAYLWGLLIATLGMVAWLVAYSYFVWRDDPDKVPHPG
jgi:uncharacterized membrane protein